jgi:hypothetical protein
MRFTVKAKLDDHVVSARAGTAREASTKAIEWHVAQRLADEDDTFTIMEFAEWLSRSEGSADSFH